MTATPTPMFVQRPDPPAINTDEYTRWSKERSIAFNGGTLTAAYGNLIQTFSLDTIGFSCNPPTKNVTVRETTVTRVIGGASSPRTAYQYTKKQFNKKNSSLSAAGYPVRVVTSVGEYTARLTGSMEALATFMCDNGAALYDSVYIYSPRGAEYGPFTPTSN
jgi:hypothetical protein